MVDYASTNQLSNKLCLSLLLSAHGETDFLNTMICEKCLLRKDLEKNG
jgi:hypothetical protein